MMNFGRDELQRDGVRGGLEQFRWDSVKSQVLRDRECYLGQSVRIGMQGKFGRFQTFDWWQRKDADDKIGIEQAKLRQLEKELQEEALGLKPKKAILNPAATLSDLQQRSSSPDQSADSDIVPKKKSNKRRRLSQSDGESGSIHNSDEGSRQHKRKRKHRHHHHHHHRHHDAPHMDERSRSASPSERWEGRHHEADDMSPTKGERRRYNVDRLLRERSSPSERRHEQNTGRHQSPYERRLYRNRKEEHETHDSPLRDRRLPRHYLDRSRRKEESLDHCRGLKKR